MLAGAVEPLSQGEYTAGAVPQATLLTMSPFNNEIDIHFID